MKAPVCYFHQLVTSLRLSAFRCVVYMYLAVRKEERVTQSIYCRRLGDKLSITDSRANDVLFDFTAVAESVSNTR